MPDISGLLDLFILRRSIVRHHYGGTTRMPFYPRSCRVKGRLRGRFCHRTDPCNITNKLKDPFVQTQQYEIIQLTH